jgi:hypothetical protein
MIMVEAIVNDVDVATIVAAAMVIVMGLILVGIGVAM